MTTSDSVSSFLDQARAYRLIQPELLDGLPNRNLSEVCDALLAKGFLTRYQVDLVKKGDRGSLTFAGFPILEEIGPFPGGTAFKALHPSLRTPLVLRRYRADWVAPSETVADFTARALAVANVVSPSLSVLVDAGVYRDVPYAAIEPYEGASLKTLVADIGAMPTPLALETVRRVTEALIAATEKGFVHGAIAPDNIFSGPLVLMSRRKKDGGERFRPAPNATVKLFELGLIPKRPPVEDWESQKLPRDGAIAYLAPERMDDGKATPEGDVYSLGAVLYFLLAGRAPFLIDDPDKLIAAVRSASPPLLGMIRPDVPAGVISLIQAMMAKLPEDRPPLANVLARLSPKAPGSEPSEPEKATEPGPISEQGPITAIPVESPQLPTISHELATQLKSHSIPSPQPRTGPEPVVEASGWSAPPYTGAREPSPPPAPLPPDRSVDVPPPAVTFTTPQKPRVDPPSMPPQRVSPPSSPPQQVNTPKIVRSPSGTHRPVGRSRKEAKPASTLWFWFAIGALLWVVAILLWLVYFLATRPPAK